MTAAPTMPELHRGQIIDLISPLSKNSANHDIEFAYRVIDALATLRPQAVPMTEGQVKQAVRFFRASTPRDVDEWIESVVRYTEEFHGITAPAGGGEASMSAQPKVACRTCKASHVKGYEFPCRDCCDFDRWEFAAKDPWPMFPMKPNPWQPAAHQATKEPR